MTEQDRLIEKLRRLAAVFSGTGYEGERVAASAAMERLREKLRQVEVVDPPEEYQFSMNDHWSRKLFVALLRRYGLSPYRYPRQRYTTVMVRVPKSFVDETLWPEFQELNGVLKEYLTEVTDRLISENIFTDTSEAEMVSEPARMT